MSLIITSGYGLGQLIPTSGYGTGTAVGLFRLDSAELPADNIVRVRFTRRPRVLSGSNASRGDYAPNYTLTHSDGSTATINQASAYSGDNEVIDLHLAEDLKVGIWTLTLVDTIVSADAFPYPLVAPYTWVFEVSKSEPLGVGQGAVNDECVDTVRKLLNPAYRFKKNWEAYIAGVAAGDCIHKEISQKAFDQAFLSSASDKYLNTRASDRGIKNPTKVGLSDDLFRQLAINTINDKLTQNSFLNLLEVFYGKESIRAFSDAGLAQPYVLFEGADLYLSIDEKEPVRVSFTRSEFAILRRATAQEIAFSITRQLKDLAAGATAVAVTDPVSGEVKVRIISDLKGLASSVRIVGGSAQPFISFDSDLHPSSTTASWTIQQQSTGRTRIRCSSDASYDLSLVEAGDYIVIVGEEFSAGNRGSFTIVEVYYAVDIATQQLEQWVEVINTNAVDEVVTQSEVYSVKIYEPVRKTTFNNSSRVVVTQEGGDSIVSIPATSRAVNRTPLNAAYGQVNDSLDIQSVVRQPNGETTVTTTVAHGLSIGDVVILDDILPETTIPSISAGTPSTILQGLDSSEREGSSDSVNLSTWSRDTSVETMLAPTVRDSLGRLWAVGGHRVTASQTTIAKKEAFVHEVTSTSITGDGTRSHNYRWTGTGSTAALANFPGGGASVDNIGTTDFPNSILVASGYDDTFWVDNGVDSDPTTFSFRLSLPEDLEDLLIPNQLNDTVGIKAALVFYSTLQPSTGDLLTVTDGTTTRTYGFDAGGDVTVTIGASIADTLTNLASAINSDGSAAWNAQFSNNLTDIAANLVVVYEQSTSATKSPLRIYGTFASPTNHKAVVYADDNAAFFDYNTSVETDIPSSDPGAGRAGFHKNVSVLIDKEIHRTLEDTVDNVHQWDDGGSAWINGPFGLELIGIESIGGALLSTPRADAAIANLVLTGGSDKRNIALDDVSVYDSATDAWSDLTSLQDARLQHNAISVGTNADIKLREVLISGGRQPVIDIRASLGLDGLNQWDFESTSTTILGPVTLTGVSNPRPVGKVGYGVRCDSEIVSGGGATQTAHNTNLLSDYTITGWMTSRQGVVFLNRGTVPWATDADNMLVSLGVDDTTDEFFVKWNSGVGVEVLNTRSFGVTRTSLMPTVHHDDYGRYYHFALNKEVSAGQVTWTLFINGTQVGTPQVGPEPVLGSSGIWKFGAADEGVGAYTGSIDEIGFTNTVLTAEQIKLLYDNELGVAYDSPADLDAMPIGDVLNTCEIVDGTTGFLRRSGNMTYARFAHNTTRLPDGRVIAAGGIGYNKSTAVEPVASSQRNSELKSAEIWDPATERWSQLPDMHDSHSYGFCEYVAATNRVYVGGGLNSTKLEYLDLKTMRWHLAPLSLPEIRAFSWGGLSKDDVLVLVGGADIATDGTIESDNEDYQSGVVSQEIVRNGGLNGEFVVTAINGSSFTIQTPEHIGITNASSGSVTTVKANTSDIPGPYSFDKKGGVGITNIQTNTVSELRSGIIYTTIDVADASNFSDSGYVVLNFGFKNQYGPIKYIGKTSTSLILKSFCPMVSLPSGVTVIELSGHGPYIPENPEDLGSFYVTASSAGRVAAEEFLNSISATGIDLKITVRYPGDRGMGAEGFPAEDNYKLSDKVWVWGGDEPDAEIEEARGT